MNDSVASKERPGVSVCRHVGLTAWLWRWLMMLLLAIPAAYGATEFGPQQVIVASHENGPKHVIAADLDGDGDGDVLAAFFQGGKVAWYENIDGAGSFGPQQAITTDAGGVESVFAADLDGDGDQDVLSASWARDDKVAWYENTDGAGTFGPQQVITTAGGHGFYSVFAADLDGDGDQDVLLASFVDDKIAWYENTDGAGSFGAQQVISTDANGANSVFAADLDGDGDQDVLSASWSDDKIAWYENTDGAGTFGPQQIITTNADSARAVFAADLDGDGDQDVLSASRNDDKIAWYENTDGAGSFGLQQVISTDAIGASSVYVADLDGDGDPDVLSASEDDRVAWYENTDGAGTFGSQKTITTDAIRLSAVYAADLDGDGDQDVLSASLGDAVAWYENTDGAGSFGLQQDITSITIAGSDSVLAADLDGDGDQDVLSASRYDNKVAWYENTDGGGSFGPQQVITTDADYAWSVFAADLDGDGDQDVLSASYWDNKVAWYENTDGAGSFGPQQVITTDARGPRSVYAADLDGDGDLDVLAHGFNGGLVVWYENTDGGGSFGPGQIIQSFSWAGGVGGAVFAADLDKDGDQDVLRASVHYDGAVAWYENTDGAGSFTPERISNIADSATSVFAADLDGDGDQDVLSAFSGAVVWYENTDGAGSFGPRQFISTDTVMARSVFAADLDGDGDQDVLSASSGDDKIAWYENIDGAGSFGPQQVISTDAIGASSVYVADLDGDGDPDVLSASEDDSKVAWYENRGSVVGACNDNSGELDFGTAYVAPGDMGTVTLALNAAPNTVAAMGFEVAFDNTKLSYTGFTRGGLTVDFDFLDVSNPAAGIVRVGGFEGGFDKITAGTSGTLLELLFTVDPAVPPQTEIPLTLQRLVDDVASFTTSPGCLITSCPHDGEVNGDGVITPQDALLAFEFYLELSELDDCEQDHADVNAPVDPNSEITPADALCILREYLGMPSCFD